MNKIGDYIFGFLPSNKKQTGSGWFSYNCPICMDMGESPDKRSRGGFYSDNEWTICKCFNCQFKAVYKLGFKISKKIPQYLSSLGATKDEIQKVYILALQNNDENNTIDVIQKDEKSLPKDAKLFIDLTENPPRDFIKVLEYMINRGINPVWYNFYWSPSHPKRFIIPIYKNYKIIGFTGRSISKIVKPKYFNEYNKNFIFNEHHLYGDRKYIILVEGPLDAISIDGISTMGNEINDQQLKILKNTDKQIILVPDRDLPGKKLLNIGLDENWLISLPKWEKGIKDCTDAVNQYGRINTITSILNNIISSKVKIELEYKNWFN